MPSIPCVTMCSSGVRREKGGPWILWCSQVQPSVIFASGDKGGIDLRQIGRDPLLARGKSEPRSLA